MKTEIVSNNKSEGLVESKLSQIKSLVTGAVEDLLKAAEIICDLLNAGIDPDDIASRSEVPKSFVKDLIKVGRQKLRAELFFADNPGKRAMRQLPYELQGRYLEQPITLLIQKEGGYDELKVCVDDMTREQANQAFCRGEIRALAEQRAWIEGIKLRNSVASIDAGLPYKVKGREIAFVRPCKMTVGDLCQIIASIER